jgi:hypothetical protein
MNKPPSDQNACPPKDTSGSWSSSITRFPASASSAHATSPASPAPTTMTSVSMALPASWLTPCGPAHRAVAWSTKVTKWSRVRAVSGFPKLTSSWLTSGMRANSRRQRRNLACPRVTSHCPARSSPRQLSSPSSSADTATAAREPDPATNGSSLNSCTMSHELTWPHLRHLADRDLDSRRDTPASASLRTACSSTGFLNTSSGPTPTKRAGGGSVCGGSVCGGSVCDAMGSLPAWR